MDIATTVNISALLAGHPPAIYGSVERRRKPRITGPFPAVVRGVDAGGETFELNAVIDNISAGGLYVRLGQRVVPGTTLFLLASFSSAEWIAAPRLALHGIALRTELAPCGACGVAVALSYHRFL